METRLFLTGIRTDRYRPAFYERKGELYSNIYTSDSHPNDKRANHRKGESRGRMVGLEEAGWVGYCPVSEIHNFKPIAMKELVPVPFKEWTQDMEELDREVRLDGEIRNEYVIPDNILLYVHRDTDSGMYYALFVRMRPVSRVKQGDRVALLAEGSVIRSSDVHSGCYLLELPQRDFSEPRRIWLDKREIGLLT